MPTIRWNIDADGDWATSADWDLNRLPNAADDAVINTAHRHTVTHGAGTDTVHTLIVGNDAFVVSGGSLTVTSAARFSNLLTVSGGTLELGGAATMGRFIQGAGTVSGTGTLAFTAGAQALNSGAILTVARWSIASGAATSVNEILTYAGAFSQNAGSTVTIAAADKLRFTGAVTLAGAVAGAGTLTFAGGTQAVESGVDFTVAHWVISNAAATTLDTSLTYAGAFIQAAGTSLTLAGGPLALTGAARLAGRVDGSNPVQLSNATLDGLTVGGAATLNDVGTVDQAGELVFAGGATNALTIGQGAVYRIDTDNGVAVRSSSANNILNSGLLIKAGGAGVSVIGVIVINSGTIEAASGTLDLTQPTTGGGAISVDPGATLETDGYVGADLAITFNGGGAVLALVPRNFLATIHEFAAGDIIDILTSQATRAILKSGDRLVIFNGSVTVATLRLAGDYTDAVFNLAYDGKVGTNITVTMPGAAPAARLIAAMASLGADRHRPAPAWAQSHADAWRPMLSAPRPVHFA